MLTNRAKKILSLVALSLVVAHAAGMVQQVSQEEAQRWKEEQMSKVSATPIGAHISDPFISATEDPSPEEILEIEASLQTWRENSEDVEISSVINVPTVFHIIEENNCTPKNEVRNKVQAQIDHLNAAFRNNNAGFEFTLVQTKFHVNSVWWNEKWATSETFKAATRVGGKNTLNVWFTKPDYVGQYTILGMARFPWWYANSPTKDGVIISHHFITGGSRANYNEGDTLVHEVGHWMGLWHTFQGGCYGSDYVSDTPAEASAAFGCPVGRDSCPNHPGKDPIRNYMDYTYNSCMYEFTQGQASRMQDMWNAYRKIPNAGTPSPGPIPPSPAPCPPPPSPSCISGEAGIINVDQDYHDSVKKVKHVQIGNKVRGFDSKMRPAICEVEAIGSFGYGPVHGNYTNGHYIFNTTSRKVEEHGEIGPEKVEERFDLIADCPLVEDETGTRFAAIDSDFCGGNMKDLSWKDYVLLHSAILKVVRASGVFWFHGSSYKDMDMVKKYAPKVCKNMLKCVKKSKRCKKFERVSMKFIYNALTQSAEEQVFKAFSNIGSRCETGSVSATVTSGRSVDESLIGTQSC